MMSGRAINYEQASTYYEHSADYYIGHQSQYDAEPNILIPHLRWETGKSVAKSVNAKETPMPK